MYAASILALVGEYRRIGFVPARRIRQVKQDAFSQRWLPQPLRSWIMNLTWM